MPAFLRPRKGSQQSSFGEMSGPTCVRLSQILSGQHWDLSMTCMVLHDATSTSAVNSNNSNAATHTQAEETNEEEFLKVMNDAGKDDYYIATGN